MTIEIESTPAKTLFIILGNQLFPFALLKPYRNCRFFMAEDVGLCTYERHHKQKLALFLATMRSYRDELHSHGCDVQYVELTQQPSRTKDTDYETKLKRAVKSLKIEHLLMWEIEDRPFEERIKQLAVELSLPITFLPSPMFLTRRDQFDEWLGDKQPRMASFYQWQRRRLNVLIDEAGQPVGGRWSFDAENRQPLPKSITPPEPPRAGVTEHVRDVTKLVLKRFPDHPGELSESTWWLPATRRQALDWLRGFLNERFTNFGPYEDALSTRNPTLYHSVLSPVMNLGLLTPREILDRSLEFAVAQNVPLNSLEGFVRQIIGWREFIRGIYQRHAAEQEQTNYFNHQRQLTDAWYDGSTGLQPMDDVIAKAQRWGWAHHIERLMVAGNLFTLCEIQPRAAYRWFMEMFVDSSEWVMVPNVYGMGIFSDGGIFSTKPYICGSNYIRKMSDYPKLQPVALFDNSDNPWRDIMDGLYWRFIDRHRDFFRTQARMAQMVGTLDRMNRSRRNAIIAAADAFITRVTA